MIYVLRVEISPSKFLSKVVYNDYTIMGESTKIQTQPIGYARFELILDASGQPTDAKILEINPGFETYFGKTFQELKEMTKFQLFADFYKGHKDEWLQAYYEVAIEGKSFTRVVHYKAAQVWFEMSVHSPQPGEFITLFQNFSNRQNNDQSYLDILTNMSDAVFITDFDGNFKFICPNVRFIFDMTQEQVSKLKCIDEVIGVGYKELLDAGLQNGEEALVKNFEQTVLDASGNVHHLLIDIKRVHLMNGQLMFVCRDVTDIHESNMAVENERMKLKTMMDTIPDLVWLKDTEGKYLACNKEFEKFYGAAEKDILGKKDVDFVGTEQADFFRVHDLKAMKSPDKVQNEERLTYRSDGRVVDVETTKKALYDTTGSLVGVLGIARDMSHRLKDESRFRELVRQAPYGIALVGDNGVPYIVNESLCSMLGYSPEELNKMPFKDFTHPDDFEEDFEKYQQLIKGEIQKYSVNKRYLKKGGGLVHANLVVCLIDDPYADSGKRALAMVQDLTEGMSMRKEYETLMLTAADPIYLIDENGVIQQVNDATVAKTGYSKQELTGSFIGLVNKRFKTKADFQAFSRNMHMGESHLLRTVHSARSGKQIPMEVNLRVMDFNGERKYFAIGRDLTLRDKQEKELLERNKQLAVAQNIAKLGSWSLDVNQNRLEWSDEIYRIFEENPNAFEGTVEAFYDFVHPEERSRVQNYFNQCVAEKKPYHLVHRILTKSGEVKHVEERASFEFDESSSMLVAHGTVQDITERIEHQEMLNRQIEQLKMVLSTGSLIAFEANLETQVIQLFRSEEEIATLGFPIHSLNNFETFVEAIDEPHRRRCLKKLDKVRSGKLDSFYCEFQLDEKSDLTWYEASFSVQETNGHKPENVFVVVKNQERQKNREYAELLGQEKERLRISRDIHDTIGQMLVGTRLMLKTRKPDESFDFDSVDEMLDSMIKESRMIINNFGISLENQENLKMAFIDLLEKMGRVYKGEVTFDWQGENSISDLKLATNIFRIFQEALSNAIKYSDSENIKINVRNYDYFFMDVWDDGVGFDVSENTSGFGIENMKERTRQMGGSIDIQSQEGKGTRVKLRYAY